MLIRSWLVRRFWNSKIWIGNILVGDGDLEDREGYVCLNCTIMKFGFGFGV
jgi:hypothetical protein